MEKDKEICFKQKRKKEKKIFKFGNNLTNACVLCKGQNL